MSCGKEITGQPMDSPVNFKEAAAVSRNYGDQSAVQTSPNSYYDGSGVELLGYILLTALVSAVTCGIAAPWMICAKYKWKLSHTVINGRRFTFDGTGAGLLGHWIDMWTGNAMGNMYDVQLGYQAPDCQRAQT